MPWESHPLLFTPQPLMPLPTSCFSVYFVQAESLSHDFLHLASSTEQNVLPNLQTAPGLHSFGMAVTFCQVILQYWKGGSFHIWTTMGNVTVTTWEQGIR